MKNILGLDLGTTSIGWAYVKEAENNEEKSSIVKLGVRVNPLTTDEQTNFEKGKSITSNADRTLKRSARRNLQRYKLRRENLIEILKENKFISDETLLSENGNFTTFKTYENRANRQTIWRYGTFLWNKNSANAKNTPAIRIVLEIKNPAFAGFFILQTSHFFIDKHTLTHYCCWLLAIYDVYQ